MMTHSSVLILEKARGKHLALMATVLTMQHHFYFLCKFLCESVWVLLRVLSVETDLDVSRMVSRKTYVCVCV